MHVVGCEYMSKNKVKVVIGGNICALQSDESEEHIQRVAKMINEKLTEIHSVYNKTHIGQSKINRLLTLNLADECVKRQETLDAYRISVEQITEENEQLKETVNELTLQLASIKEQLEIATYQKKKEHTSRGR